ncbi:MAG: hypothetical protein ABGY29_02080, partial [bacterium]
MITNHPLLLVVVVFTLATPLSAKAGLGPRQVSEAGASEPARNVEDEALKYWPQWRGPSWNGVAPQADPPITWSETENLRWKTPIEGKGYATPVVWGDRIFLLTAITLDKQMPVPDVIPADTPNINEHPQVKGSWKPQRFVIVCLD